VTDGSPATVVLVHGAFHGPWCWERVVALLTNRGIPAIAVDRRRGDPLRVVSDMAVNARLVRSALDAVGGPVVLCGHSAGGPIITDAGTHPSVRQLVYIAARMPGGADDPLSSPTVPSPSPAGRFTLPDGSIAIDPEAAAGRFYNDCDPSSVAWAASRLTPQEAPYDHAVAPSQIAWRERPSTYVVCSHDRALAPEFQRLVAARATRAVEWDTGHSPFLVRPQLVADLLEGLAREASQ
jgi:hypothetical protein